VVSLLQCNTGYIFPNVIPNHLVCVLCPHLSNSGVPARPLAVIMQNCGDEPAELLSGFGPETLHVADKSTNRVDLSATCHRLDRWKWVMRD